ncbi:unnamed protein product [Allacma fusca]|uniref:Uncharacterized protein n=1 Tax=Allacma fusca TaxID=39272 RepID=A0A8J2NVR9_9HEXA|nr:unnamed protein product [Allacma fusca]
MYFQIVPITKKREKYVGNIFVPDGSCETQMVKSNLPSNCSEDSHLLEESCTSSRYSPSETPTVEATQNMKDYVTFRKNSREYLTFKKANLKEKTLCDRDLPPHPYHSLFHRFQRRC